MAADNGSVDSMFTIAATLNNGNGVPVDKQGAAHYYKLAIQNGSQSSIFNYALMLDYGDGIPEDKETAVKLFKIAADNGPDNGMLFYVVHLIKGDGVQQNTKLGPEMGNLQAIKVCEELGIELDDNDTISKCCILI